MATGSGWHIPHPFGRGLSPGNHTRFPVSPHQTVREVFPHTAFLWELRDLVNPLASSKGPEDYRRLLASAIRLSCPSSDNTHSRSPSLPRSYVVFGINRCRVGGGALPRREAGLRPPPKPCVQISRTRLSRNCVNDKA